MTVNVTGLLQHEAWLRGTMPPTELVRPGLWSVPVPIPDNPLRYVSVYVFELADGVAVIDAGWPTPDSWDALVHGLAATGHDVSDVRAVLVTHAHADHYGLAPRLRAESGAWVALHEQDAALLRPAEPEMFIARSVTWLRERGTPDDEAALIAGRPADYRMFFAMEPPDRLLADGDQPLAAVSDLTVIWTPGHSPGHVCFHVPSHDVLLSGDHVLPRITPNITSHQSGGSNPLDVYLASLRRIAEVEVAEVLPAHEFRFSGLGDRVRELLEHHVARFAEAAQILSGRPGATTWEVAQRMEWSRSWDETRGMARRAAVGETLAHLVSMEAAKQIERCPGDVDSWVLRPG